MMKPWKLIAAILLAAACEKPAVAPGLDLCNGSDCSALAPGIIQGNVVYAGTARGDAVLLLFDVRSLPPPDGTGTSAVAVARVPEATLFASAPAGSAGPFSAPFIFTQVPADRSYQIRAFLDVTHEFDPFFDYTQQPRAGAPVGGYGTIGADGRARLLSVKVEQRQTVSGINVALIKTLPFDPPSFEIVGGGLSLDVTMDQPVRMQLRTRKLDVPGASFAKARFALELDRGPDGNRRSTGKDGLDDVFPQVFLRQIKAVSETSQLVDVAPDNVALIPCRVISTPVLPALVNLAPGADPLASDVLDVLVQPFALKLPELLSMSSIPRGTYQVVVVERSGQVWTVPNSLGDSRAAGTPYYASSQAASVSVGANVVLLTGSVSGQVIFRGDPATPRGNIIVQAFADDPTHPPPPLGATPPVRVQIIRAGDVKGDPAGFLADYKLTGLLPGGKYVIVALADVDGNFSPLNLLATPTRGDLLARLSLTVTGEMTGRNLPLTTPLPDDPPAFEVVAPSAARMPADQVLPVRFDIQAKALNFPLLGARAASPQFGVQLVRDAGGALVDADGDGLPDVWPRVFLVRLDPNDPTQLSQVVDPDTLRVATQVIPAAVDPTPFLPALQPVPGSPAASIATDRLTIVVRPVLLDASAPFTAPRRMPSLQPGPYKVVLVSQYGQVWQIPNEAAPQALDPRVVCGAGAPSCAPGTFQTQGQGAAFVVTPPAKPAFAGSISGTLTVPGSFFAAYVFAYAAGSPPPFGTPVSADVHYPGEFQSGKVRYVLPGLATGNYLVTALIDTRGDFAVSPAFLALAPGGGNLATGYTDASGRFIQVAIATSPLAGIDLTAAAIPQMTLPARPSFQLVDGAGSAMSSDAAVSFGAAASARFNLQAAPVLVAGVAKNPDSAAAFPVMATACDAVTGVPTSVSPAVRLIKVSDAAGLVPELDANRLLTAAPAALDPAAFPGMTCNGSVQSLKGPFAVVVQNASVKVDPVTGGVVGSPGALLPGRYQVVVSTIGRQVWRVPNELQPGLLDPKALLATPPLIKALLQTQQAAVMLSP